MKKILMLSLLLIFALTMQICAVSFQDTLTTKDMQTASVSGGNLVADAIRSATKADISFLVTSDLKEYTTKSKEVSAQELLSFVTNKNEKICTISITGKQIKSAMEKSLTAYPRNNPGFLQVSGITVTVNTNKQIAITVKDDSNKQVPIDENWFYLVAISESLSKGSFGYWKIWDTSKSITNDVTFTDSINMYSENKKNVNPIEKRIIFEEESK